MAALTQHRTRGYSVIELLTVLGLIAVLSAIAVMNLKEFDDPLQNAIHQLTGFLKQVRAEAISSTSAYTILPSGSARLITKKGKLCSDPSPVFDTRVVLDLPTGAHLADTEWTLCFDSRGLPDANLEIDLSDAAAGLKTIEIMLGGAVRIK